MRIAINGFGRIGRLVLRAIAERKDPSIEVVAINDLGSLQDNVHLFKYDSVHGRFPGEVKTTEDTMDVGMGPIKVVSHADPKDLPWGAMNIDLVMECSGRFTSKESAQAHIDAGAKKVLISAPATGADMTVVYGVNHDKLKPEHTIVSNASCTTNCLAPVADVIHRGVGIVNGYMTTIHAYTADQRLVDSIHKDLHRARAAALSMIPSSTGAAKAIGLKLYAPESPSNSVTAIYAPEGIDSSKLVKGLRDRFNMTIANGQDDAKGKIFRIGHLFVRIMV